MPRDKKVKIVFCEPCGFFTQARDLKREIEEKFQDAEVELEDGERGVFDVYIGDRLIFSRYKEMKFPQTEEILEQLE